MMRQAGKPITSSSVEIGLRLWSCRINDSDRPFPTPFLWRRWREA
jgi:hypothetical protein